MKPSKAYIIKIDNPISEEYAKRCAESCDKIGLDWEYFNGYVVKTREEEFELWNDFVIDLPSYQKFDLGAAGATASHLYLFKKIYDNKECAIILEHDSIMLQPVDIDIPDDRIVVLGYKYLNYKNYDYQKAGKPKSLVDVSFHSGAHAYCINYNCAKYLIEELERDGVTTAIDNRYFMHSCGFGYTPTRFTKMKLSILDPTPAIGILGESTIWRDSSFMNNFDEMLESFKNNFNGDYTKP